MKELNFQLEKAGQLLEKYVDVDAMIGIAESALWEKEETVTEEVKPEEKENLEEKAYSGKVTTFFSGKFSVGKKELYDRENSGTNTIPPRIAVAKDEAFWFLLP